MLPPTAIRWILSKGGVEKSGKCKARKYGSLPVPGRANPDRIYHKKARNTSFIFLVLGS
jgi:hypothetical protein